MLVGAAEGFRVVGEPELEPRRVRVRGARSVVERLEWLPTERVEIAGAREPVDREVALVLPEHVWLEREEPVRLHLDVEPIPAGEGAGGAEETGAPSGPGRGGGA